MVTVGLKEHPLNKSKILVGGLWISDETWIPQFFTTEDPKEEKIFGWVSLEVVYFSPSGLPQPLWHS